MKQRNQIARTPELVSKVVRYWTDWIAI